MQAKQLGSLLVHHRKLAGLNQTELAEHAGVSRYVVQDLEAGSGRTTWSKLEAVLQVLNLKLEPEGPMVEQWKRSVEDAKGEGDDNG